MGAGRIDDDGAHTSRDQEQDDEVRQLHDEEQPEPGRRLLEPAARTGEEKWCRDCASLQRYLRRSRSSPECPKQSSARPRVSYSLVKAARSVVNTARREVYFSAQRAALQNPDALLRLHFVDLI